MIFYFFFFNDTATTEIYTLSLHDALPIWQDRLPGRLDGGAHVPQPNGLGAFRRTLGRSATGPIPTRGDRKSTRLNSSHVRISYAVFCLKKKKMTPLRHVPALKGPYCEPII